MPQEKLREREGQLVRIIEALNTLENTHEWSTLKNEVFNGVLESLEGRLSAEANKPLVDLPTIYKLQGRIHQAKKYDFVSLIAGYRLELKGIRQRLTHGDGAPYAPDTVIKL